MDFLLGHLNLVTYITISYITFMMSMLYYRHQIMMSKYVIKKILSTPLVCKIFVVYNLVLLAVFLVGYITYITFCNVTRQTCLTFAQHRPVDLDRAEPRTI